MAVSQSSVHYRFGNNSEFKTLSFDGIHIAVDELKKSVAAQEGINLEYVDFTLTNANTKRVYEGSNIIPRNSCVVVARVPREHPVKMPKVSNTENSGIIQIGFNNNGSKTGHINQEAFNKMTEQERILHAIAQSTEKYDPSNYKKRVSMSMNAKASPDHVCNKCNKLGHFPKQCPMLNYRLSTGIPSEELMETTQDDPNAMYHPSGRYVIPIMHYKARETRKLVDKVNYERSKLLNGASPYQSANSSGEAEKPSIPDELKCPLCNDLLTEALLAPCCGESFCAMCIHDVMLKGSLTEDGSRCPTCVPPKPISADSLIPNKRVRDSVVRWKNNTADHSPPGGSSGGGGSSGSLGTPRIASPIPLSAVVLEQKAAAANGAQVHETPPAIVKLPTVNLSAMLAQNNKQLPPAPPPAAVMAPMFMPPVVTSGSNSATTSNILTTWAPPPARLESSSSSETVNRNDKPNARPSAEPIASTSTTSSTAAPPGLSESVYQHEPVYKCPTVTDPQIQADEDAMSRAWDVVFNTDETLDIFVLHKTRTSTTDKDKDTNKSKRRSDDRDSRRDYRDRDAGGRRKERSRSRDRDRHGGHRERRDEEDSRGRHGRATDHRRYDDRDRRRGERERDRYHKEDRYVGSSRKRTRSRSKSPDRKRHRSDSRERKYGVDSREKKASERSLSPVKKHARSRSPEKSRRSRSRSPQLKRRTRSKSPEKRRRSGSTSRERKRRSRSKSTEKKDHARSKSHSRAKSVEQKPESMEIESLTDDLLVVPTKEHSPTPMEVDLPASQDVPKLDRANSSDSTFFPSDNSESDLLKLSDPVQNPPKIEVTIRSFQLPEAEPSDLWKKQYAESVPEELRLLKSPMYSPVGSIKQSPSPETALKKDDSDDDDESTKRSSSKSKKKKKDKKKKHRHSSDESESERTEKKKKKKDKKKKHRSDDESDDGHSEKKKKHKKKHKKHRHEAAGDASDEDNDKKKKKKEKKKDRRSEDRIDKTSRRSEERSEKKSRRSEDRFDKKADRDRDSKSSHRRHHDDERAKEESSRKRASSPRRERSSRDYRRR
uniref:E3 ubiquitin-protein ligase RBBP6 n=1 Tax=Panagrellus redivivus TaxID=6233 RepID=A0A7E4V5K8_PANRE